MNNCWTLEKCCLALLEKRDLCTRYQNNSSTEIGVVDHNSREEVGTPNNYNPEEVGRRHSNTQDHHRKVTKSVCLVLAGLLKRVVSVDCPMALDSVLHL